MDNRRTRQEGEWVVSELKDCPFCGSNYILMGHEKVYEPHLGFIYINCDDCGVRTIAYEDENKTIKSWNRRTPIKWPTDEEEIEATKKYMDAYHEHYSSLVARMAFEAGINWLKSFVEKDKSE